MDGLRILILGPPRIELNGETLSLETRRAVALLAYLVVSGPCATREALAALLFPDYEPTRAFANLRRTIWTLNRAGAGEWLDITDEQVGLKPQAGLWADVSEFRHLWQSSAGAGAPALAAAPCLRT